MGDGAPWTGAPDPPQFLEIRNQLFVRWVPSPIVPLPLSPNSLFKKSRRAHSAGD